MQENKNRESFHLSISKAFIILLCVCGLGVCTPNHPDEIILRVPGEINTNHLGWIYINISTYSVSSVT
jgi:hypothetical protein